MTELLQDLSYFLRRVRRDARFALALICTLGLGVGVNAALISYFRGLTRLAGAGIPPDDGLLSVRFRREVGRQRDRQSELSLPVFEVIHDGTNVFATLAGWSTHVLAVDGGGRAQALNVTAVTSDYFRLLRLKPLRGTLLLSSRNGDGASAGLAIVSERYWRAELGAGDDAIGRRIHLVGVPFTVVGVAPPEFGGLYHETASVWISTDAWHLLPRGSGSSWLSGDSLSLRYFAGRLGRGVRNDMAKAVIAAIGMTVFQRSARDVQARLTADIAPARIIDDPSMGGSADTLETIGMLATLCTLLLAITCSSVCALLLGKALARRQEVAVRLALGASRARVVRQLLTESVVLAVTAGVASLVVLWLTRDILYTATADILPVVLPLDSGTVFLALACAVGTGILFGLTPALHATRTRLFEQTKSGRMTVGQMRTQRALVVTQVAIVQPLLFALVVPLSNVVMRRPWEFGVAGGDSVLVARLHFQARGATLGEKGAAIVQRLRDRVRDIPGVVGVSFATRLPMVMDDALGASRIEILRTEVKTPDTPTDAAATTFVAEMIGVDADFFTTIGQPLLHGRSFLWHDTALGGSVIVVPADLAQKLWPRDNPIGAHLERVGFGAPPEPLTVIGVVRQTKRGIVDAGRPVVYVAGGDSPSRTPLLLVRTRGPANRFIPLVSQVIREADPELPIMNIQTLPQALNSSLASAARLAVIAASIVVFALLLSAASMAGVVMASVNQRAQETALRLAVGASPAQITTLFVGAGVRIALIAIAIASPVLIALTWFIGSQLGITAGTGVAAMVAVHVLIIAVILISSWIPARRAAAVDPVYMLRAD